MDDTTDQFEDDVDARLEELTQTGKEVVQGKGDDVEINEAQQGNENLETTQEQVVDDAHVTITTTKKTQVPVTSSSRSFDLASKFLNFSDIPHTDAEIVSPLDVHVHHEVPRTQAPTLLPIPVSIITESSPVSSQPQSTYEAASTLTEFELKKILLDKMEKRTKSQPKSSEKSVQSEEPVFEVVDSDMPQDQEGNLGDNEDEPRNETASRCD
ncbi:hypothetical protein Tco_1029335 [Tanacetum coccineum]|uniref:Uncharacterized protein n=1 Tax=Tanacetum coccineum TaxID=301880 RepID=A0ABQ5G3P6_9ASTR